MIGGPVGAVKRLDSIFKSLAPGRGDIARTAGREKAAEGTAEEGYLHCGPAGAGHFVKMVHNGIEYGVMAAYAEGFNILRNANVGARLAAADAETAPLEDPEAYLYDLDVAEIAELFVPYMDPDPGWSVRTFLDLGENDFGFMASPLQPGTDCPAKSDRFGLHGVDYPYTS